MNARHLHCFIAIYEERTITAAAERLRVSVSSLSHHLFNLEDHLAVKLFTRQRRGMEPTADGERFFVHARGILAAMAAAEEDMRDTFSRIGGHVSVSMAGSATRAVGFDLVNRLGPAHPDLRLTVNETLSSRAIRDVADGRAHLGLAYNVVSSDAMRVTPLLREDVYIVGQPALVGPTDTAAPFETLFEKDLLLLSQGLSAQALVRNKRLLKRMENHARLQINSVHTMIECLLAGLGVTVGPYQIFSRDIIRGALAACAIVSPRLDRVLCLVEPRLRSPSYAVEHVRGTLIHLIADSVKTSRWRAELLISDQS